MDTKGRQDGQWASRGLVDIRNDCVLSERDQGLGRLISDSEYSTQLTLFSTLLAQAQARPVCLISSRLICSRLDTNICPESDQLCAREGSATIPRTEYFDRLCRGLQRARRSPSGLGKEVENVVNDRVTRMSDIALVLMLMLVLVVVVAASVLVLVLMGMVGLLRSISNNVGQEVLDPLQHPPGDIRPSLVHERGEEAATRGTVVSMTRVSRRVLPLPRGPSQGDDLGVLQLPAHPSIAMRRRGERTGDGDDVGVLELSAVVGTGVGLRSSA